MMRKSILMLSVTFAAGLLFVNMYNSLIDAVNWGSNMPLSIQAARNYFNTVNPGNFYRIFSPVNQVLAITALVTCWKAGKQVRLYCALALLFAAVSEALTFGYFYPRNEILFTASTDTHLETIKKAWSEWTSMNWIRSLFVLLNLGSSFFALARLYKIDGISAASTNTSTGITDRKKLWQVRNLAVK